MAAYATDTFIAPETLLLKELYSNLCNSLTRNVKRKLRDGNSMKSNCAEPHLKTVILPDIPRLIFTGVFVPRFSSGSCEILSSDNAQKRSPVFSILALDKVVDVFSANAVVKCHASGDVSIISPIHVYTQKGISPHEGLTAGSLIMPVSVSDDEITFFLPCSGFDPDSNAIPAWADKINVTDIVPSIDPTTMVKTRGIGKMSAARNTDYTSIRSGQVEIGDIIVCRGEWNTVSSIADDAFFPEGYRNSIRFTKTLKTNVNSQPFEIVKSPQLYGKIMTTKKQYIDRHQDVLIVLENITAENVGNLKITYKNLCFNSLGFMTHDTHVLI